MCHPQVINCLCQYFQHMKFNELALFRCIEIECLCAYCSTLKCSVCDNLNKLCKASLKKIKEKLANKETIFSIHPLKNSDCMAQMRMKMRVCGGKAGETESAPPVCRSYQCSAITNLLTNEMHQKDHTNANQVQNRCETNTIQNCNTNAKQKKQIACHLFLNLFNSAMQTQELS